MMQVSVHPNAIHSKNSLMMVGDFFSSVKEFAIVISLVFLPFTAKGKEWTNSSGWGEQFTSVCDWHGVICNDANQPVELDLKSNGLSGKDPTLSLI